MWLNIPELGHVALDIDLDDLDPKGILPPVQKKVDAADAFYSQYQPLIIDEVFASLKVAAEKSKKPQYEVRISPEDKIQFHRPDNVTVITLKGEGRIDCIAQMSSSSFIMAEIWQTCFGYD